MQTKNPQEEQTELTQAQARFAEELRSSAQAAENVFENGADEAAQAAQQIQAAVGAAGEFVEAAAQAIQEQAVQAAQVTDEAIRKHPYQAVGIAFGIGLLAGYLIKRK